MNKKKVFFRSTLSSKNICKIFSSFSNIKDTISVSRSVYLKTTTYLRITAAFRGRRLRLVSQTFITGSTLCTLPVYVSPGVLPPIPHRGERIYDPIKNSGDHRN